MDSTLWPSYKVLCKKVTSDLRKFLQQYYHTIIKESCNDGEGQLIKNESTLHHLPFPVLISKKECWIARRKQLRHLMNILLR